MSKIKVLVVDDSALMRKRIKEMLESDPKIEVIGLARNGEDAIKKAKELSPDVITLDVNMPVMDGLTALKLIVEEEICPVIMVSSLTQKDAEITFKALELGAFDFVPKPGGTISLNIDQIRDDLIRKVKAAVKGKFKTLKRSVDRKKTIKRRITRRKENESGFKAICIGISTGGPKTIFDVLPYLPKDINAAIFLVQHMPPGFTASFAKRLDNYCEIKVKEAEAGDIVEPGICYLGKGGYHLTLFQRLNKDIILRLPTKPEHLFMPSVDVMMDSVVKIFQSNTIGVLMTGMGDDGAEGMVKIKNAGGYTIAESEETAVVFGMPAEAIKRGGADIVLPSYEIANEILRVLEEGW
ncbi:chemotaxis-specific methylesterase CheB [Deferribacter desulfuricans SSM1]|uniref:Protein-glutamate methylesterase/protein-glutamine glutaminase n=1 Tax=Deferribacter desulfuricans (strain DSM 14783 / JCM 11476 / NBRC 101012 / SSM1) TaxID=639282 RepID=D3PDJ3_DEFDS|nr:chemotaxis response regulator protein-glutamate methylesterase [Deferribacter desulfuricans]BAI80666.1 chemotaxis-specific methylesterase CheB [Deferribacter desulfuricans SSM1]